MNSTNHTNYTKHYFSNEHGITGNLAADPKFLESKNGKEYAEVAIYCKAAKRDESDQRDTSNRNDNGGSSDTPLVAYVKFFGDELLDQVDRDLKKGYFVNFKYDGITVSTSKDTKTGDIKESVSFVATSFEVRHTPGQGKTAEKSNQRKSYGNQRENGRNSRKKSN